jgi:hypothetical protein
VKFHLKTWSVLPGIALSLALVAGCSNEEAAPDSPPPSATPVTPTDTKPAEPAPSPTPAADADKKEGTPPAAVEAPKEEAKTEAPKEEAKPEAK